MVARCSGLFVPLSLPSRPRDCSVLSSSLTYGRQAKHTRDCFVVIRFPLRYFGKPHGTTTAFLPLSRLKSLCDPRILTTSSSAQSSARREQPSKTMICVCV